MRKMKSLLCVLLTMIISLGSMVTVKADTEIKPYENKENAVLLKREYIDLDEDTVIEIESYEEKIPSLARAGWKTTSATKTYRVKDKNTNTVFVKYILKATFRYNGKKAECTNATPDCKILVPNVYKVITKDASKAGDVALGYFYCQHIKTGKGAGGRSQCTDGPQSPAAAHSCDAEQRGIREGGGVYRMQVPCTGDPCCRV